MNTRPTSMVDATLDAAQLAAITTRLVGSHQGSDAGPLVVCVGGIHGNEYAGVLAARAVLGELAARRPGFRGKFVALAGNLGALQQGRRFQDLDLNRAWLPERLAALQRRTADEHVAAEDAEQLDLLAHLSRELDPRNQPAFFLDLHTSSADGAPFITVGDTLRNRAFARRLGLPIVLGLEEQIDGALLEHLNNCGHVTVGVEGGRHGSPSSVRHHEAVLWLALIAAGNVNEREVPSAGAHRELLRAATPGVPGILQVRHRHGVQPEDRFVMKPGFRNFDQVRAGDLIADDVRGPIPAPETCRLLLPLYQNQGDDGFFTVKEVKPFWLELSWLLRRVGLPRHVARLPGVRRHPTQPESLIIHTRVAHFLTLQIFHLLGYRKRRWEGDVLVVSRRRHDVLPGRPVEICRLAAD